ncbi:hypothetical protein [Stenotrophomonas sp. GZD-301]|jgi:hypothetical protein|uniref:hypothetical protein n=1 Tax=Stenotrophomonas sp. GZD-301 TaxID=3404814 RepID=UPI003BB7D980
MSSTSSRHGAGPANRPIAPCPVATQAQQLLAQQQLTQAASRALAIAAAALVTPDPELR